VDRLLFENGDQRQGRTSCSDIESFDRSFM
jgi:hypothetical protein